MATMKCAVRLSAGVIEFADAERIPVPTPGTVRLRVKAASLNPIDYKMPKMSLGKFVGCDVAGVIDAVHQSVTEFAVGDEVYGVVQFGKSGGIADFCLCEAKMIAKKPSDLPFTKAAAAVVSYITSYGALVDKAKGGMKAGDTVLIIGDYMQCDSVCMFVCLYACMYICMLHVHMYICVYVRINES